ncbi:hypothetical protein WIW50_12640 [Flavobacteriaceae bacterium 3-367]|uniref:hypothetical protein n=1 Tax=Eudoraea algarum TaxID=3417568 RepID=UPI00327955FB
MESNVLTDLSERIHKVTVEKSTVDEKRERNRGTLAMVFVILFFCVIFVTFIIGYTTEDFQIQDYKDLLTTVSSILSGPLGFIIGFYFKEKYATGTNTDTT